MRCKLVGRSGLRLVRADKVQYVAWSDTQAVVIANAVLREGQN